MVLLACPYELSPPLAPSSVLLFIVFFFDLQAVCIHVADAERSA